MTSQRNNIFIEIKTDLGQSFDLVSLSEIFSGLDLVIKELYEISNINGDFNLKVDGVEEGSVIVTLYTDIISNLPFDKAQDFYNFLIVASPELYLKVSQFFSDIKNIHRTINDYFALNPLDQQLLTALFAIFVTNMVGKAQKYKNNPVVSENDKTTMPQTYAYKLHNMVLSKKFKKVVLPVAEDKIKSIKFGTDRNFNASAVIDNLNFENYLSDDEKILPDFVNGQIVKLKGKIVGIQSTRGEILKFRALEIDPKYQLLVVRLDDGKSSENYLNFYKKQVNLEAEVFRNSLYKKPEIIIKEINLLQPQIL